MANGQVNSPDITANREYLPTFFYLEFSRKREFWKKDRPAERQIDREKYRQTHRQRDRKTDRQKNVDLSNLGATFSTLITHQSPIPSSVSGNSSNQFRGPTDRRTDRQTDRPRKMPTEEPTDRQIDRQTD